MNEHEFYTQVRRICDRIDEAERIAENAKVGMIVSMIIATGALLISGALIFLIFGISA